MPAHKELSGLEATKLMRALSVEDREAAIHESRNVIGYGRFMQQHNQVAMREVYQKPPSDDGPKVG